MTTTQTQFHKDIKNMRPRSRQYQLRVESVGNDHYQIGPMVSGTDKNGYLKSSWYFPWMPTDLSDLGKVGMFIIAGMQAYALIEDMPIYWLGVRDEDRSNVTEWLSPATMSGQLSS